MKRFGTFTLLSAVALLAYFAFVPAATPAPAQGETIKPFTPETPFTPMPRFEEPTPPRFIFVVREVETAPTVTPFTTPRNDAPNATNVYVAGHDNASVVHVHNGHNIVNNYYRKRTTDMPIDRPATTATATVTPVKFRQPADERCETLLAEHKRTVAKWTSEW